MAKQPNGAQRVITATELRRNFKAVVRQIRKRREHAVIESSGEPVAVILSVEEYEKLVDRKRRESLAAFNEFARNLGKEVERRGLTEEELLADLEETKREVFEERY